MGLRDRLRTAWVASAKGARVRGFPPSANGASSFHVRWEMPPDAGPLQEVACTLEVVVPPTVPRLYFWALQVGFTDQGRPAGGAHLGLQWHPGHPRSRAANWGGYDAAGIELEGSASALPSATGNLNTRDYPWEPGVRYRLSVRRGGASLGSAPAWVGEITDLGAGVATPLRELYPGGGTHLDAPLVWSEVFARCDDPSVVVRWSDLEARTADGRVVHPVGAVATYQPHGDGGCDNTRSDVDGSTVVQTTNADRSLGGGRAAG